MKRAAVIIGVNQTGNLPRLQAAVACATQMSKWAKDSQKFDSIVKITDEAGEVTIGQVKKVIKDAVNAGEFEQLIVYFSGHGVNIAYGEYWLLTGAPEDPNEAVNVEGSVRLARQSLVPHVVFISDACRTAADGIQAQAVEGSNIFPNQPGQGPEKKVDLFFATFVGNPAYEVKDPNTATAQYKAIYTDTLNGGLSGSAPECLEAVNESGTVINVVRPWPLKNYLDKEVPRRMRAAGLPISVFQVPDARITSPPSTCLARILPSFPPLPQGLPLPPPPMPTSPIFRSAVGVRPETAFFGRRIATLEQAVGPLVAEPAEAIITTQAQERSTGFGRAHFESRCGFKVRGGEFVEGYHPRRLISMDGPDSVTVFGPEPGTIPTEPASVVLRLKNGKGTILPAIPEFVTALTLDGNELVDVVYEPSDTSIRWNDYQNRLGQLRRLRGRIAAAARFGVFRLEGEDAMDVARQMQYAKGLDPTMAVYAAYAYDSLQENERIQQMDAYLSADLGLQLFDVALLAGELNRRIPGTVERLFPPVPMLSQGWALLSAHNVSEPLLQSLRRHLEPSLWTLFDSVGIDQLKSALNSGAIH
jgi:hypothetical protein